MTTYSAGRGRAAILIGLLLLGLGPASPGWSQGVAPSSARVADILAQFPANDGAGRDQLADQVLSLGEEGLAGLTAQLVPSSVGSDVAVRFALNAVAARASRAGAEPQRALAERAFITALGAASDVEVRTFLLSQLRLVGREASVKAAAPLLADAALVEPAAQLMLTIKGPAARAALAAALPKVGRAGKITIVKAIGELGAAEANGAVLALAADPDPAMRRPVLATLAALADPKSYAALTGAVQQAGFKYEPANAIGAVLDYAANLGKKGSRSAAERTCRFVMKNTDDPSRLATRAAALAILSDVRGPAALPDLIAAVDHADKAYRNAALARAERLGGPAAVTRWVAKARRVDGERRAEIIAMLARQGSPQALPFIRESIASPEPAVALASATALAHAEKAKAVPDLLKLLARATDDTAGPVADVLLWTIDEANLEPLAAMLDTLQPSAKAAALGIIGARGGKRFSGRILPLTGDSNPAIRAGALKALAGVVGAGDLPLLVKLLDGAEAGSVADVQKAVGVAAGEITPDEARATAVLGAMKSASRPERFIELLSQVGGRQAFEALDAQFASQDPAIKAAAFRALAAWSGPEAAGRLFTIYASGDAAYKDQAFAGYVRQVSTSAAPADQKVLQLRKVLALSPGAREKRTLIRALERARAFQSFLVASSFLEDHDVANDAAGAVMRLALPAAGEKAGLTGTLVRKALEKVIQVLTGSEAEYEKESIRTYLASMPQDEGFVQIFNGRDLTGWQGLVKNPIERAKMTPQELAAAQPAADAKARTNWSVRDGMIVFSGTGDNLCTVKPYGDFEMVVDWRITKDGDSGVYLRGTPQVQIWDPARTDVGAQVGSGGLYNNQTHPSKPLVFADNPVGEWNTFRITMVGEKVTVFLNGVKVVGDVTLENYWDRSQPIFPREAIELQAHGTDLAFRDIYVREIAK